METVLVVDDDTAVRAAISAALERVGYTVLNASTAIEGYALTVCYPGKIHLLITDHHLGSTRGRDLADQIRARRPVLKVIHVSGHPIETLIEEGSLTPEAGFVQKPFSPRELRDKVREVLDA